MRYLVSQRYIRNKTKLVILNGEYGVFERFKTCTTSNEPLKNPA